MIRRIRTHRLVARIALALLLFASLQAVLSPAAAESMRRYAELTAAAGGLAPRHDHKTTICHSCPDHICLEQHGAFARGSAPPLLLADAGTATIEPWPSSQSWAHPPTAPPRAGFIHSISLPRGPPHLT